MDDRFIEANELRRCRAVKLPRRCPLWVISGH